MTSTASSLLLLLVIVSRFRQGIASERVHMITVMRCGPRL